MESAALLIDFGSTYTKLRAVDLDQRRILGAGQGPSTVASDIMVGMKAALQDLERRLGGLPRFRYRLASSSASEYSSYLEVSWYPSCTIAERRPSRAAPSATRWTVCGR